MHLITPLASGIAGATDGTVKVYRRGTSTLVTVYADFEGTTVLTSGGELDLDVNGGLEAYVAELVDVKVYDADGALVREFTDGCRANLVEVESTAFTGTDYGTAASAAGEPADLDTVLDRWLTNNGAIDWKVLVGGSAVTIQSALAGLAGLVVNVKAPEYGAVGNGVADDSAAIQAAEDAVASGGIVFFPAGDYYLNGTTIERAAASRSSWLGTGAGECRILTNGSDAALEVAGTAANQRGPCYVTGIGFVANANPPALGTTCFVELSGTGVDLSFRDCYFGGTTYYLHACVYLSGTAPTSRVLFSGCTFATVHAEQHAICAVPAFDGQVLVHGCFFVKSAGELNVGLLELDDAVVSGNHFDCSAITGGTGALVTDTGSQTAGQALTVTGNGATHTGLLDNAINMTAMGGLIDAGNGWSQMDVVSGVGSVPGAVRRAQLDSRIGRRGSDESNDAALTVNLNLCGTYSLLVSDNEALTLTLTEPAASGMVAVMVFRNASETKTLTITGVNVAGDDPVSGSWMTVPAEKVVTWMLWSLASYPAGTYIWALVSASTADLGDL